jgi:multidrug efflux pump subunit AcrA (membrane-fusion protein)
MALKPNTTVNVRIQLDERKGVLAVPRAAVELDAARRYVYVVEANQLRRREVQVGMSTDTQFEIVGGVSEGDQVALPGDAPLQDGLAVRIDSVA